MEAKAKWLGHPIHQMVIVFPLGLLAMAVIFDAIGLLSRESHWIQSSYYMIAAGLLSGLVAAVFGVIDYRSIPPRTRAQRIGFLHGVGNDLVVVLFASSWLLRRRSPIEPPLAAYGLSYLGAGLALVTGWLGGELVDRLGIGVNPEANPNAPSSLRTRHSAPSRPR